MNPSISQGEISTGIELFRIFRSEIFIDTRWDELAAPARYPLVFFTSLILSIGIHIHLNRFLIPSLFPRISYLIPKSPTAQIAAMLPAMIMPITGSPFMAGNMKHPPTDKTSRTYTHISILDL